MIQVVNGTLRLGVASFVTRSRSRNQDYFFQAEDGIRDLYVTGVQTCALPICLIFSTRCGSRNTIDMWVSTRFVVPSLTPLPRSEERRVGKECIGRWVLCL